MPDFYILRDDDFLENILRKISSRPNFMAAIVVKAKTERRGNTMVERGDIILVELFIERCSCVSWKGGEGFTWRKI